MLSKITHKLIEAALAHPNRILTRLEGIKNSSSGRKYIYERPLEYAFALQALSRNEALRVLDVGAGKSAFGATLRDCGFFVSSTDQVKDYWKGGFSNRHVEVIGDDIRNTKLEESTFDAVTCISVLEHIAEHDLAVKNMSKLLKDGGILILTFPYTADQYCPNVYALEQSDSASSEFNYIAQSFSDANIESWCSANNLKIAEQKYFLGWSGKFWRTGERITFPRFTEDKSKANGTCLALIKNPKST